MNCMEFMLAANARAAPNLRCDTLGSRSKHGSAALRPGRYPALPVLNACTAAASRHQYPLDLRPSAAQRSISQLGRSAEIRRILSAACIPLLGSGRLSEQIRRAIAAAAFQPSSNSRMASADLAVPAMMGEESPSSPASMDLPMPDMLNRDAPSNSMSVGLTMPPMMGQESHLKSLELSLPPMMGQGEEARQLTFPLPLPLDDKTSRIRSNLPAPPIMKVRIPIHAYDAPRNDPAGKPSLKDRKPPTRRGIPPPYSKRLRARKSGESYVQEEQVNWATWSVRGLSKEDGSNAGSGYGGDDEDEDGLQHNEFMFGTPAWKEMTGGVWTTWSAAQIRDIAVAILWS